MSCQSARLRSTLERLFSLSCFLLVSAVPTVGTAFASDTPPRRDDRLGEKVPRQSGTTGSYDYVRLLKSTNVAERIKALSFLKTVPWNEETSRTVLSVEQDMQPEVRRELALALTAHPGAGSATALLRLASDPDLEVRRIAIAGLGSSSVTGAVEVIVRSWNEAYLQPTIIEALFDLNSEPGLAEIQKRFINRSVASNALPVAMAVLENRLDEKVEGVLTGYCSDPNPEIRGIAVRTLNTSTNRSVSAIVEKCLKDPDPFVRSMATLGLGKRNGVKALPQIETQLRDASPQVRISAIKAAWDMESKDALPALVEMTKDSSPEVVSWANLALFTLTRQKWESYKEWKKWLKERQ